MAKIDFTSPRCGKAERRAPEMRISSGICTTCSNMRGLLWAACLSALATAAWGQDGMTAVHGTFQPLNPAGEGISGTVSFTLEGDMLGVTLEAEGLSPGMHLAHVHGFAESDPADATCPDTTADANDDGWVDLIETQAAAGVTMIPFTDDPVGLAIQSESYPSAGDDRRMNYEQTVDPAALHDAVEAEFGTPLALPDRVVFIHGVQQGTELPDSVQSLEGVPASVTVPIACAELDASGG